MANMETFEKLGKHFFVRKARLQDGNFSKTYYGLFVDKLHHKQRSFALGGELDIARARLGELERKNFALFDFDAEKETKRRKKWTFSKWADRCIAVMPAKTQEHAAFLLKAPKEFFKDCPLESITAIRIQEYVKKRSCDFVLHHGKPSSTGRKISPATRSQELGALRRVLRMAEREDLIPRVPEMKPERSGKRTRVLTANEYKHLVAVSPRWFSRLVIAAYETGLTWGDLVGLTWDDIIDDKVIKIARGKTGAPTIVPISPALRPVLEELLGEYRAVPNIAKLVFPYNGKMINYGTSYHHLAKAGLKDFNFHDLRHTAITRWAAAGLPIEVAMIASGHKIPGIHGIYVNLTDQNIIAAFERMWQAEEREREKAAS